jgi:LmbE family N-acetylglucosaminyl deacetylase
MKILAIGAHPDDAEICCFGTLARCVERGDSVVVCAVTNGNQGHSEIEPTQLRVIRMGEGAKSAQVIGASYCTLDIDDMALNAQDEATRLQMTDLLRSVQPDLIITHAFEDYHPDHVATAELVFYCMVQASLAQVKTKHAVLTKPVVLYHMDKVGGGAFIPTDFVDIQTTFDSKLEALSCHASQLEFLKKTANKDLLHATEVLAEYRGLQCGCRYAEGFRISDRSIVPARRLLP